VSSISRAMCNARNASQPPPETANPRVSTQNQKSEASTKQLAQVDVALLLLRELEQ